VLRCAAFMGTSVGRDPLRGMFAYPAPGWRPWASASTRMPRWRTGLLLPRQRQPPHLLKGPAAGPSIGCWHCQWQGLQGVTLDVDELEAAYANVAEPRTMRRRRGNPLREDGESPFHCRVSLVDLSCF
jgi:hypothetical protein